MESSFQLPKFLFSRLETEEEIGSSSFFLFFYLCENPIDFCHSPKASKISSNEESSSERHTIIRTSLTFFFSGERNLPSDALEMLDPSLVFPLLPNRSCLGQYPVVI